MVLGDSGSGPAFALTGGEAAGVSFVEQCTRATKLALHRRSDGLRVVVAKARYEQGSVWSVTDAGYAEKVV